MGEARLADAHGIPLAEETHHMQIRIEGTDLDGVPPAVLDEAARTGLLVGRLGLTDPRGNPTCSAGRPPTIEWSAGIA